MSKESIEKTRNANIGRKHSEETKLKMSKTRKGRVSNRKGATLTVEQKIKISKLLMGNKHNLGKKHTEKTKEKISIAHSGRNHSNYNPTPILQYDKKNNFIKEWKDLISLKDSGFNSCLISSVCHGKRKSHNNFFWKFKTT